MSFRTDIDTMTTAAGNVDRTNAEVQQQLQRLQTLVAEVNASWKGEAQASFHGLMQRWDDSARKLNRALNDIADNIRANARAFQATEADNAAAFR